MQDMKRRKRAFCLEAERDMMKNPVDRLRIFDKTPDMGKAVHGIAAVELLLDHNLDQRPETPVLLPEPIPMFSKKLLKN